MKLSTLRQIADRLVKTELPFSVVDSYDDFVDSSGELFDETVDSGQFDPSEFHRIPKDLGDYKE